MSHSSDHTSSQASPSPGQVTVPVIVIHGGAWAIPQNLAAASVEGVKRAARAGHAVLTKGESAVDAVEAAVSILEDDPAFDAGTGSVLNADGEVEMDAVVMDGSTLKAGGVACVQNIKHPIQLARLVMDKTDHVLLVGKGANKFAGEMGIPTVAMETLVTENAREEWKHYMQYRRTVKDLFSNSEPIVRILATSNFFDSGCKQTGLESNALPMPGTRDLLSGCDTVGAVALDTTGNVAFATSTGGITAKRPGRVGDSPIVGAGGYADSLVGAVSTTGHGEAITRTCLAHRITSLMETGTDTPPVMSHSSDHTSSQASPSPGQVTVPVIVIHGGAWAIPQNLAAASVEGVKRAARAGHAVLTKGESAVDAVEAAVSILEDDPAFDAGTGSVLNADGEVEMDAVVMDGSTLKAGGVACVQNIKHPIQLARLVMDKTDHVLLVGKGANKFAGEMGIPTVAMETLVTENAREEWKHYMQYRRTVKDLFSNSEPIVRILATSNFFDSGCKQTGLESNALPMPGTRDLLSGCDTVGAVALDTTGNVAFATSTGGITAKRPGRVGDSPIVGAGGYADSLVGAVSTTGHGEAITRTCLAHRITSLMETGQSPDEASRSALDHMTQRVKGSAGVVIVSAKGEVAANFNTQRMAWAWVRDGELHYGLNPGQHEKELL